MSPAICVTLFLIATYAYAERMAHFYVYENWRAHGHRATVHEGRCGYCNEGQGVRSGTRSDNGTWHGPFVTFREARDKASQATEPRLCAACRPSI